MAKNKVYPHTQCLCTNLDTGNFKLLVLSQFYELCEVTAYVMMVLCALSLNVLVVLISALISIRSLLLSLLALPTA